MIPTVSSERFTDEQLIFFQVVEHTTSTLDGVVGGDSAVCLHAAALMAADEGFTAEKLMTARLCLTSSDSSGVTSPDSLRNAFERFPEAALDGEPEDRMVELAVRLKRVMGYCAVSYACTIVGMSDDSETESRGEFPLEVGEHASERNPAIMLPGILGEVRIPVVSLERLVVDEMVRSADLANGGTANLHALTALVSRARENGTGGFDDDRLERLFSNRQHRLPKGGAIKSRYRKKYEAFLKAIKRNGDGRASKQPGRAMARNGW